MKKHTTTQTYHYFNGYGWKVISMDEFKAILKTFGTYDIDAEGDELTFTSTSEVGLDEAVQIKYHFEEVDN